MTSMCHEEQQMNVLTSIYYYELSHMKREGKQKLNQQWNGLYTPAVL